MKKALAIFLAVTMLVSLVSLAACGNKKEVETKNEDESADQTIDLSKTLPHEYIQEKLDAGQEVIVAYAATTFDNGTAMLLDEGFNKAFTDMGFKYLNATCDNDTAKQIEQIENFVTMNTACIIITSGDPAGIEDCVTSAEKAGTYCVFYGAMPEYSLAGTVNIDLKQLGEACAKTALAWIDIAYPDATEDDSIHAAAFGFYVVTETGIISDAMRDTLDADPRVKVVYEDNNCQGIESGFSGAEAAFTYDSSIKLLLIYDVSAAVGANNYIMSIPNADLTQYGVFNINYSEEVSQLIDSSKDGGSVMRGAAMGNLDICAATVDCVKGLLLEGVDPQYDFSETIFSVNAIDYTYEP